jgi:hypothetical protein
MGLAFGSGDNRIRGENKYSHFKFIYDIYILYKHS